MARIYNVQKIVTEDFPPEHQEMISKLGYILNNFMIQVTEMADNNIDFENLSSELIEFDLEVASNGSLNLDSISTGNIVNPLGFQVISVINQTSDQLPTGQPFISYTPQGNGLVTLDGISNLPAGNTYSIRAIVY